MIFPEFDGVTPQTLKELQNSLKLTNHELKTQAGSLMQLAKIDKENPSHKRLRYEVRFFNGVVIRLLTTE